jgi:hypothetical protein
LGPFNLKEEIQVNVIDLLLNTDGNKLKMPTKEVEIKRLSRAAGEKVIFKLESISMDKYVDIGEMSKDPGDTQIFAIIEGVKEPNLRDKDLMNKYNSVTPKDLVKKLLLPGEIGTLYSEVSELSGFDKDMIEEVKNS